MDDNDHSPVFTQSLYSVAVAENVPVGHDVIKVSATDSDIGANALVSYWIAAGNYGKQFTKSARFCFLLWAQLPFSVILMFICRIFCFEITP